MIFRNLKDNIFNKNLGKSQRYTAFTLAEVMIVIGIIGIVAEMTLPSLVQNYQKQITISK
jgi:prepilin-type N-terminal cleavage/methylation domain-containing protein